MEKYTVSLDLARKLREAGYPQDTYWFIRHQKPTGLTKLYWKGDMDYDNERFSGNKPEQVRFREENEFFAAPLSDELLEQLPGEIDRCMLVVVPGERVHVGYAERDNYGNYTLDSNYYATARYAASIAGALAEMWLWVKNGDIK